MYCKNCMTEIDDNAVVCPVCGTAVQDEKHTVFAEQQPVYSQSGYEQPAYSQPVNQQPAYSQPGYEQPAYSQPVNQQPAYSQPGYEQPAYSQPVNQQPAYSQPGYEQPMYNQSGSQSPVYGQQKAAATPVGAPSATTPLILGIISLAGSALGIVSIILGAVAIKKASALNAYYPELPGQAKTGKILGILGLVFGIVWTLFYVLYFLIVIIAIASEGGFVQ